MREIARTERQKSFKKETLIHIFEKAPSTMADPKYATLPGIVSCDKGWKILGFQINK